MKLFLAGYGKMGKAVEACALERGHEIAGIADSAGDASWHRMEKEKDVVAIEFSQPAAARENFTRLLRLGIPVVTGTTGWSEQLDAVKAEVEQCRGAFVHGSNYSVGVNLMFALNRQLAAWMKAFPGYDVSLVERHHRHKKDAPGGTALSLVDQILSAHPVKRKWVNAQLENRPPLADEMSVAWIRAGEITGEHEVSWTSAEDEITLAHRAFNRQGFALGAVMAAEWLNGKRGFHNFADIFSEWAPRT